MTFHENQASVARADSIEPTASTLEQLTARLQSIVDRFEHALAEPPPTAAQNTVRQSRTYLKRILVKSSGKLIIVSTENLDWIEAWGDYVRLHCKDKTYIDRHKIGELEIHLDPEQFLRIGRSAIINIDSMQELEPLNHGDYLVHLRDKTQLNLSRNYRDRFAAIFHLT